MTTTTTTTDGASAALNDVLRLLDALESEMTTLLALCDGDVAALEAALLFGARPHRCFAERWIFQAKTTKKKHTIAHIHSCCLGIESARDGMRTRRIGARVASLERLAARVVQGEEGKAISHATKSLFPDEE